MKEDKVLTLVSLQNLITAAEAFGINYVFIDKNMIDNEILDNLKNEGYSVVVGQGEVARVKISW